MAVPHRASSPSGGPFCVGPDTSLALWFGNRILLDVFRGPCEYRCFTELINSPAVVWNTHKLILRRQEFQGSIGSRCQERNCLSEALWATSTPLPANLPRTRRLQGAVPNKSPGESRKISPSGLRSCATGSKWRGTTLDKTSRPTAKQHIRLEVSRDYRTYRLATLHDPSAFLASWHSRNPAKQRRRRLRISRRAVTTTELGRTERAGAIETSFTPSKTAVTLYIRQRDFAVESGSRRSAHR